MNEQVRWALVGYGSGGRIFHAPLITSAPGLELTAVVTTNPGRRARVAADLPGAVVAGDLAELPELGVHGVTVTTPPATHADLAHRAIDLGLAVVVDKPFALTAPQARELVEHAHQAGVPLSVYQNRRWDSDFRTVQALLARGTLGRVHTFISRIDRFRPLKPGWTSSTIGDGGGTLLDLGPHLIDQATQLFGPVKSVYAELDTVRDGAQAEDNIEVHLRHAAGVRSVVAAGMASAAPGPRLQINGTLAGFGIDGFDIQEEQLKNGGSPATLGDAWGVEPESAYGTLYTQHSFERIRSERGGWDRFYPAVATAVSGRGPMPVDPADAVHTAAIIDAARLSAQTQAAIQL